MRALIIRFHPIEGPGIIEEILTQQGFGITYHDAFKKNLNLMPNAHLMFSRIVLMGGPDSVYDNQNFFYQYYKLIEEALKVNCKILGVCLGSQIIAQTLGAKVEKGSNGQEIGFGTSEILLKKPFMDFISGNEFNVFHFHGDTYPIPKDSEHLMKSDKYPSQMFLYDNKALGIQFHLELTEKIFKNWILYFPEVRNSILGKDYSMELNKIQLVGRELLSNYLKK